MSSRGFFLLLLLFTCACFAWWVFQIERLHRDVHRQEVALLYLQVEKAQNRLLWVGRRDSSHDSPNTVKVAGQPYFFDDSQWNQVTAEFPALTFTQNQGYAQITPRPEELTRIRSEASLQEWRQMVESILFFGLLLTGFIWIYRGLNQAIQLNEQQNHFLVSVTHELKTPVASIKILFETLRMRELDVHKKNELCTAGLEDGNRLLGLVESILVATRLENKGVDFKLHELDFSAWLQEEIHRLRLDYHHTLQLEQTIEPGIRAKIEPLTLRLSLCNLIENARNYSGKEQPIGIRLTKEGRKIRLLVSDQGPGIPPSERKKIFKKFYRSGDAFTQRTKGTGLGLFIVGETIKRHGGKVWVEDAQPRGTIFNIAIPTL